MNPDFSFTEILERRDEAMITVLGVPDKPGVAARLFGLLARNNIPVNMIVQNSPDSGSTNITFTLDKKLFDEAAEVCREMLVDEAEGLIPEPVVGRIIIRGHDLDNSSGIASSVFDVLAGAGINIFTISATSEFMSFLVRDDQAELGVRLLKKRFDMAT